MSACSKCRAFNIWKRKYSVAVTKIRMFWDVPFTADFHESILWGWRHPDGEFWMRPRIRKTSVLRCPVFPTPRSFTSPSPVANKLVWCFRNESNISSCYPPRTRNDLCSHSSFSKKNKNTTLAMMASLPILYSEKFAIFFLICTNWC